jgi:hypothetical protein
MMKALLTFEMLGINLIRAQRHMLEDMIPRLDYLKNFLAFCFSYPKFYWYINERKGILCYKVAAENNYFIVIKIITLT